jgi:hypothetical protein
MLIELCTLIIASLFIAERSKMFNSTGVFNFKNCLCTTGTNLVFTIGFLYLVRGVGIAIRYGLDGPGIESRWGARFSALVFPGVKAAAAWG